MDKKYISMRSQDLPLTYIPNGAIYIASVNTIKSKQGFYNFDTLAYIMGREDSIDIDEPIDLHLAELLLKKKNSDRGC
jgi:CMP-N-acetylneuraminic acid synthetase